LNRYVGGAALLLFATLSFAGMPSLSADAPVAIIDGKPVLASELAAASQGQILNLRKQEYDINRRALDAVIEQKLLEMEAARRGITVNQLQKEMDNKVGEPTDAEVEAFYLARQDQAQRRFEEVRDQMRTSLKMAKRNAARDAFMSNLRANHGVEVLLESPRVEVAFDPVRLNGSPDAPVRVVEFSDFECPYCRSVEKTIQALLAKYPGKVSLAYRDSPLTSLHPGAQRAAEASRCAAEQGKFWPYHDRLLASSSLDVAKLKEHAKELGLDQKKFDSCVDTGSQRAAVDRDAEQGRLAGVSATPSFFINGIPLSGAQPAAAFEKIIEEELARKSKQTTVLR
jgi:predicted DsbA family dithiol-disulfide isomerase